MKLHVLLLTALPMCLAEFTIQGPSDGHRRAQGLKFSEEKGIEYTDASEGGGPGDFTIQGATDGNTNFRIQGATDGHSNFQIQGPTDGGSATYNVQGPIDRYGQPVAIQGAYDANQAYDNSQINGKALQYNDPSGYRVNWRSYDRQARPQAQPQPQYAQTQAAAPVSRAAAPRQRAHQARPQPQPQPQPQVAERAPSYKPYANAPPQIQQLLQFQQQIPYINIIPEPYRFDEEAAIQAQSKAVREHLQKLAQEAAAAPLPEPVLASTPRQKSRGHPRSKRQAQQQHQQPQYRRISQPPAEPQPHYSTNLPNHLLELLKFQAQTPYNIIANQIVYRPDKPYVPQPVDAPQQQLQQQQQQQQQLLPQQPIQQAQYQGQSGAYQGQPNAYTQANLQPLYNQNQQYQQLGYNQQQPGVRPVTENQY
ncbi:alpha/beta-gliadin clone PW8142-like [Monomorium pharaonis]|uniref:alpha/beta-gliadin clone PW8142 n=1 Tax=Monomorium pharaonis TaxID=307658 RepID=UPI001746C410|nr:alpha/beta-gliadin clone PW8142 [Monomorium pharaonis]XP_036150412.1 alpha/beta-gliadin clone PW8142-like [Monomorium pharaonis]